MTDKARLVQSIITALEAELTLITQAAQSAREEAIDEESRPENQYDMHSQEAAYLAEGQARLAAEIRDHLDHYRALDPATLVVRQPIALGALITLSPATGPSRRYFLGPRAGGLEVPDGDGSVLQHRPSVANSSEKRSAIKSSSPGRVPPLACELPALSSGDACRPPRARLLLAGCGSCCFFSSPSR
jgi:hypothetical protein